MIRNFANRYEAHALSLEDMNRAYVREQFRVSKAVVATKVYVFFAEVFRSDLALAKAKANLEASRRHLSSIKNYHEQLKHSMSVFENELTLEMENLYPQPKFALEDKIELVAPPKFAEYLLYLFLSRSEREYIIGDLVEDYGKVLIKFGRFRADVYFYKQVWNSLWPLVWRSLWRLRAIAELIDVIRRFFQ